MIEGQKGKKDSWNEEYQNGTLLLAYEDLILDDLEWLNKCQSIRLLNFLIKKKL